MGKLQEFLMDAEIGTTQTEVQIAPFPFPFVIRSITEAENKAIRKTCQKVEFDKKTRQKRIDTDTDLYNARLVAACCIDPNFKDADFQAKKGVRGAEDLINLVLNPGQYTDLHLCFHRPSNREGKEGSGKSEAPEGQEGQVIKWPAYLHSFRSRTE